MTAIKTQKRSIVLAGVLALQMSASGCLFKVDDKDIKPSGNGVSEGGGGGGATTVAVGNAATEVLDFSTAVDVMTARLGVTPDLRPLGNSGANTNHVANGRNQVVNILNLVRGGLPENTDASKVSESQLYALEVVAMGSCKAAVDNNTICTGINRSATLASVTTEQVDSCANELSKRIFGREQATGLEIDVAREIASQIKGASAAQLGGTSLPQARYLIHAVCTAFASSAEGRRG